MGERILRFVGQTFLPVWFHTPPTLLGLSILCVCLPNTVDAQDGLTLLRQLEATNIRIIEKAEPSVVAIARVRKDVPIEGGIEARLRGFDIGRTDRPGQKDFVPNDFGAGVIIDSKNPRHPRLILTNYHVVRGGPTFGQGNDDSKFELWVTTANRKSSRSTIIAADPHSDLAVITVGQLQPANLPALTPTTYTPRKGQFIFALGNPYTIARDGSASATWGVVSNVARSKSLSQVGFEDQSRLFENVHQFGTLLQIGVALPIGTSGGALLNLNGDLVGITTSLAPLEGFEQSAGYAIPFTPGFERVVKELSAGYEVEYGFLGIRPADATIEDFDGLTPSERPNGGAVALSVTANAPAAQGKVVAGDVVVEVGGVAVSDSGDLMREIALIGPNNTTNIKVWRPSDQTFVSLKVSLGKWPVRNDDDVIATAYRLPDWRGIRVDYSTARSKYLRSGGVIEFEPGVLVVSVDEQRHGLKIQAGDFIGRVGDKRIRTPAEFNAAVIELGNRPATLHTTDRRTIEIDP